MHILFFIVVLDLVGFGLVIPLLPFYATRHQASPEAVTLLMASYSAAQLFAAPLWGRLSDRIGRRPVLLVSLAGSVVSYLWLGFADTLWMLFAARALQGACAGNIAAAQAYVADVTTPENRAKGMGMIGAAFGLGFIIGPGLAAVLAGYDNASPRIGLPPFAAAGFSALALVAAALFLKESLPTNQQGRGARIGRLAAVVASWRRVDLRRLIGIYFLVITAFAAMETTFAIWALAHLGWGPAPVGWTLCYVGILSASIQGGLIGRLARRFGEDAVLRAGLVAIAIGLVALPFCHGIPSVLAATACLAIGMGMTQPSINSLISRAAGSHEQGQVLGVSQSAGSLARIVGPSVAGVLFGEIGADAPFLFGVVLVGAALLAALRLRARVEGLAGAPER